MGIICGFLAALCNSFGYLLNARFLKKYNEPGRLLTYALICMLILSVPFAPFLFPFASLINPGQFALKIIVWVAVFMLGQGAFFLSLRFFEASRLSSLLGLKIIVLAAIFILFNHGTLNWLQWLAICISAISAMIFNWSGAQKQNSLGWIFVFMTLICFSLADILETSLVMQVKSSGFSDLRSAFSTVSILYPALGLAALPGMLKYKPSKDQFCLAFPYAAVWLLSQISLLLCFAKILPVYGNVILATRGVFSVLLGITLPIIGLGELEQAVSRRKWLQRIIGALLMVGAIALYSRG